MHERTTLAWWRRPRDGYRSVGRLRRNDLDYGALGGRIVDCWLRLSRARSAVRADRVALDAASSSQAPARDACSARRNAPRACASVQDACTHAAVSARREKARPRIDSWIS